MAHGGEEEWGNVEVWAIVELMGHVRIAGRLTEEEHFGAKMGRLDIPNGQGSFTTQWFGGSSVYRITPVSEEIARGVAARAQPEPVHRWELPAANQVEMAYGTPHPDDDRDANEDRDLDGEDY